MAPINFTRRYRLVNSLGVCSYIARRKGSQDRFFVKKIPLGDFRELRHCWAISALEAMSQHDNIIRLISHGEDKKRGFFYIFYYLFSSDLRSVLDNWSTETLPLAQARAYLLHLLRGVAHVHEHGYLHRNIKPSSVLIDERQGPGGGEVERIAVLGGFQYSRSSGTIIQQEAGYSPLRHMDEQLFYKAPELLISYELSDGQEDNIKYSSAVDIWALGCIFAEMVTGTPLFQGDCENTVMGQLRSIFSVVGTPGEHQLPGVSDLPGWHEFHTWQPEQLGVHVPALALNAHAIDLLQRMLSINPRDRISAQQCLQHIYLQEQLDI